MGGVCTYAGTGRQLWLDCAPCCPPLRYWPLPRCPSFVSWYEHDLDDRGGGESQFNLHELLVFTPTPDRDAGEEKVCGGQNGEDLDEAR